MATHTPLVDYFDNLVCHPDRWCRNGQVPAAGFRARAGQAFLHAIAYRRKRMLEVSTVAVAGAGVPGSLPGGAAGSNILWRFAGRTGMGVRSLRCSLILAIADNAAAVDPYVEFSVTPGLSGGAATAEQYHDSRIDSAAVNDADDLLWVSNALEIAVNPDANYRGHILVADYARVVAASVHEIGEIPVDDADTGAVDPRFATSQPIYDPHVQDYAEAATDLWQTNAGLLLEWHRRWDAASSPTFTTGTFTNIVDGTSTAVAASSPPVSIIDAAYRATRSRTTVPVRLLVHAARTAGAGTGEVRIYDGTNQIAVTGITTEGWYSTTGTVPATDGQKWDAQARQSGGATTIRVDEVLLEQYE
jgi:hypothetical protein